MKQKDNTNTKQGHSANMLLYAVAPKPKLSTDSNALDSGKESSGIAIGATSESDEIIRLKSDVKVLTEYIIKLENKLKIYEQHI